MVSEETQKALELAANLAAMTVQATVGEDAARIIREDGPDVLAQLLEASGWDEKVTGSADRVRVVGSL